MPYGADAKKRAREYVDRVRTQTECVRCGAQPIEWHNVEHEHDSNRRVAHLTALGFPIAVIQREMDASVAVCRRCHMKMDGRLAALTANRPFKKGDTQPPVPCDVCGTPSKPRWRGMCRRCYDRRRRS